MNYRTSHIITPQWTLLFFHSILKVCRIDFRSWLKWTEHIRLYLNLPVFRQLGTILCHFIVILQHYNCYMIRLVVQCTPTTVTAWAEYFASLLHLVMAMFGYRPSREFLQLIVKFLRFIPAFCSLFWIWHLVQSRGFALLATATWPPGPWALTFFPAFTVWLISSLHMIWFQVFQGRHQWLVWVHPAQLWKNKEVSTTLIFAALIDTAILVKVGIHLRFPPHSISQNTSTSEINYFLQAIS